MVKLIVSGAAGKMGKRIINAVAQTKGAQLAAALENPNSPSLGLDAGEQAGINKSGVKIGSDLDQALAVGDVLIEFTSPAATIQHLQAAVSVGKGMVIGTTGLSAAELVQVEQAGVKIPCVLAPNMSVGVNLLLKVLPQIARVLQGYDIEIIEAHHRLKKDAPSGTALKLAQVITQALDRDLGKVGVYGRRGISGERPSEQIGIHAVRAGDIVGDHTVLFSGPGESIEIIHRAHSRDTFAQGAVKAALFLAGKSRGLYNMQDVLGL
ncbi:MAG: 4-hydroxy-tetrahydrodipicolinate reductase [Candidatus Schekmanbacteria bacterium]|nr:4-hydroxy-tetrahydrodipicolinate reductase [Candidatus Schekmanbacteria bacterium]